MSYVCTQCEKSFKDPAERTCGCKAPMIASMKATVYGRGSAGVGRSPLFDFFRTVGRAVLARGV
jgi:hypothetical protein